MQAQRERRAAKADNKNGNPIALKSKLLAAIRDPASPSSIFVAESAGSVRRLDVDVGQELRDCDLRERTTLTYTTPIPVR